MPLDPNQSVDAAIRAHPALMQVLIREHMACVGCPLVTFCSLDYAAAMYGKRLIDLQWRLDGEERRA